MARKKTAPSRLIPKPTETRLRTDAKGALAAIEELGDITSAQDYEQAGGLLTRIKGIRSDITARFAEPVADAKRAYDSIRALKKDLLAPLDEAESLIKQRLTEYQERLDEASRQLEADLKKGGFDVIPSVSSSPPKVDGVTTRTTWKGVITDEKLLIDHIAADRTLRHRLLTIDRGALTRLVQAERDALMLPGLEVKKQKIIAASAR